MPNQPSPYAGLPDRPVFVGACPRSGTTLLRTMLNTHPDLAVPRETRYLLSIWENRARWRGLSEKKKRTRLARVIYGSDWTQADRLRTSQQDAVARFAESPGTLGSLLGTTLAMYAEATGKKRWGDKRPMYARYLDAIFGMFPDAQFINVVRDPRASVASMRKLGWYDGDMVPGVELWMRSVNAVAPWRERLGPDQYLDIRYEDLVHDPESLLQRITDFLDLSDAVQQMLHYYEKNDEKSEKYHPMLNQPVTTDALRAWESVLNPDEVALIEQVSGAQMDRLGYERATTPRPSSSLMSSYRRHHRRVALKRGKLELEELRRKVDFREPVMAKLTTGQREIGSHVPTPPFFQRHLGKPR
ncbi:MAG TPA: sulfotransferase [Mycobacteriales bacterium]|nr:sulfotransferase [Mycobacteriales bacterium]